MRIFTLVLWPVSEGGAKCAQLKLYSSWKDGQTAYRDFVRQHVCWTKVMFFEMSKDWAFHSWKCSDLGILDPLPPLMCDHKSIFIFILQKEIIKQPKRIELKWKNLIYVQQTCAASPPRSDIRQTWHWAASRRRECFQFITALNTTDFIHQP